MIVMNIKFLILSSLIIALLSHVLIFNLFTFVFHDNPAQPKPKFFFLGPILTHKDVKRVSESTNIVPDQENIKNMSAQTQALKGLNINDEQFNETPYVNRDVPKPYTSKVEKSEDKVAIKSTFQVELSDISQEPADSAEDGGLYLEIKPYKPLTTRSP